MVPEQTDEAEAGSSGHARCRVFCADSSSTCDVISAPRHERTARAPVLPRACTAAARPPGAVRALLLLNIFFYFK